MATTGSAAAGTATARKLAGESIVLLKNANGALPLATGRPLKLALLGKTAVHPLVHGGGSGQVSPSYLPSPYAVIRSKLGLPPPPPLPPPNCSAGAWDVGFECAHRPGPDLT